MMATRQKSQIKPASKTEGRGEALDADCRGTEAMAAKPSTESPAEAGIMEEVVGRENLFKALARVKANGGAPGVDGVTVEQLSDLLRDHWPCIKGDLLKGDYQPQPIRRVEIPKPDGGTRKLGIDGSGPICPTGCVERPSTAMGPNVLRAQLRIQAGPLGASGGCPGAEMHPGRIHVGCGSGLEENLRPGEPRCPDGSSGKTNERQAGIEADSRLSGSRCIGARAGWPNGRRNATGRATISLAE